MNIPNLQRWLESSVFELLVGVALASSLLCIAAWVSAWLLRRQSAAARFGVWQLALGGVLLAALLLVSVDGLACKYHGRHERQARLRTRAAPQSRSKRRQG